jgi:hypothetical protein
VSLFVCSDCQTVENTALCGFWFRPEHSHAQCSACDPAIGAWHGIFERVKYDGTQRVFWKDGESVESEPSSAPRGHDDHGLSPSSPSRDLP